MFQYSHFSDLDNVNKAFNIITAVVMPTDLKGGVSSAPRETSTGPGAPPAPLHQHKVPVNWLQATHILYEKCP